jgi:hypothetical protein
MFSMFKICDHLNWTLGRLPELIREVINCRWPQCKFDPDDEGKTVGRLGPNDFVVSKDQRAKGGMDVSSQVAVFSRGSMQKSQV